MIVDECTQFHATHINMHSLCILGGKQIFKYSVHLSRLYSWSEYDKPLECLN